MLYYVNNEWSPKSDNPFSKDGSYDEQWSSFIYDDSIINTYSNVFPNAKVYSLSVKPQADKEFERLLDFINYETSYGRNIILKVPELVKSIISENISTNIKINNVRLSDSEWLVHSTTRQLWNEIKKTGALLSPNYLKNNGRYVTEIGLKSLLEPKDYSDFVMLDVLNGCGEIVVNSRQLGYICLDPNVEYMPGVRIYFDAHKIISDGLATRDGLHALKVFERLPLDGYMVMFIDDNMLPKQIWTPTSFTNISNKYFLDHVNL